MEESKKADRRFFGIILINCLSVIKCCGEILFVIKKALLPIFSSEILGRQPTTNELQYCTVRTVYSRKEARARGK
jgi:hypothetical protein